MNQYYNCDNDPSQNYKMNHQKEIKNHKFNIMLNFPKQYYKQNMRKYENERENSQRNKFNQRKLSKQSQQLCMKRPCPSKSQQIQQKKPLKFNRQIQEEYKLEPQRIDRIKSQCEYQLSNCKFIKIYLKQIDHHLKQEKKEKQILKRRNEELVRQNKMLNYYFKLYYNKQIPQMVNLQSSKASSDSLKYSKSLTKNDGLFCSFKNEIASPYRNKDHDSLNKKRKSNKNYKLDNSEALMISSPGKKNQKYSESICQSERSVHQNKCSSFMTKSLSQKPEKSTFYASKLDD